MCGRMSTRLTGTGTGATLNGKRGLIDEFSAADGATPRFLQPLSFPEDESALAADSRCNDHMQIPLVSLDMLKMVVDLFFAYSGLFR